MPAAVAAAKHQQVVRSSRPKASESNHFLAAAQWPCSHARAHARARKQYENTEILRRFQISLRRTFRDEAFRSERRVRRPYSVVREDGVGEVMGCRASRGRCSAG